jgi:16S rRNA processing protein RimM
MPQLIAIGQVRKPFGLKGHCYVDGFGSGLARLKSPCPVLVGPGETQARPVVIAELKSSPRGFVCRFDGAGDRDAAEAFRDVFIFVDQSELAPLKGNEFYHFELEGMTVVTAREQKPVGVVLNVENFPTVDALNVRKEDGSMIIIALGKGIIEKIDRENKCVVVSDSALEQII